MCLLIIIIIIIIIITRGINVEHCGASVSKQSTVALNGYVPKALQVKYEITAHRLCMAYS